MISCHKRFSHSFLSLRGERDYLVAIVESGERLRRYDFVRASISPANMMAALAALPPDASADSRNVTGGPAESKSSFCTAANSAVVSYWFTSA